MVLELTFLSLLQQPDTHSLSITPYLSPPPPCFTQEAQTPSSFGIPPLSRPISPRLRLSEQANLLRREISVAGVRAPHTQRDPRPSLVADIHFCPGREGIILAMIRDVLVLCLHATIECGQVMRLLGGRLACAASSFWPVLSRSGASWWLDRDTS